MPKGTFYLEVPTTNLKKLHEVINYYWKGLKAGINYTKDNCKDKNRYKKSFLFKYLDNQKPKLTWEKKYIKEHFFSNSNKNRNNLNNESFARALLGLPDKFSYMRTNYKQCKPDKDIFIKGKIDISVKHTDIERIKAPIIFKPIIKNDKYYVFIIIDKEFDNLKIFDTEFEFNKPQKFDLITNVVKYKGIIKYETEKIDTTKKWSDFERTDVYKKTQLLQDIHKNDNRIKFQLGNLKFIFSLPDKGHLVTPNSLNLNSLLEEYHKYTDIFTNNKFTPKDFRWNTILKNEVRIKKII